MGCGLKVWLIWSFAVLVGADSEKDAFRAEIARTMSSYMDKTISPCEDIYQYTCGNFETAHPIPANRPIYRQFNDMFDNVDNSLRELVESVPESSAEGKDASPELKAKRFYESCVNRELIDTRGTEPVLELLEQLGGWPLLDENWSHTKMSAEEFVALTNPFYSGNFISVGVSADLEVPTQHIIFFTLEKVGSLTKADLKLGANSTTTKSYQYLIIETLKLFGISSDLAEKYAAEFIEFEMKLLEFEPEVEGVNYVDLYTKMSFGEFIELFPHFQWKEFVLKSINQTVDNDYIIAVVTVDYFQNLFPVLRETEPKLLANWIMTKIVMDHSTLLDQRFLDIQKEAKRIMSGVSEADPTWKRCIATTKRRFSNALSAMYVEKYFSPESREDVRQVAEDIRREIRHLIEEKEWLQEPTKKLALEKLDAIEFYVGYDDKVLSKNEIEKEYKDFNVDKDKFFENVINIDKYKMDKKSEKLDEPVENKPVFSSITVNAGYNSANNKVELPAAFLQPPIYHKHYPRALIYGSIGAFIGHEIGHAFDRSGRQFDKIGTLSNWWDDASIAAYNEKCECFIEHYSQYSLYEHKLNGTISLGETMSDNSGLRAAYFAYRKWWDQHQQDTDMAKDEVLSGMEYSNFGLLFLKYAQGWCESVRPEIAHIYVQFSHPPGAARLRGTFANNPSFATQFGCEAHANCLVW